MVCDSVQPRAWGGVEVERQISGACVFVGEEWFVDFLAP